MNRYFATHLYVDEESKKWIGYSIKKEIKEGVYRQVGVIYQRKTLKKVLKALNGEKGE